MDIQTAKSAAQIVVQIERLQALIAEIDLAITETEAAIAAKANPPPPVDDGQGNLVPVPLSEGWLISSLILIAPEIGSTRPGGTSLNLLVGGVHANAANSLPSMQQAKTTYTAALDALTTQLGAL
mgnify:CR=1 FL=1